jgi:hypothetical protein
MKRLTKKCPCSVSDEAFFCAHVMSLLDHEGCKLKPGPKDHLQNESRWLCPGMKKRLTLYHIETKRVIKQRAAAERAAEQDRLREIQNATPSNATSPASNPAPAA